MKQELVASHEEAERATKELDALRTRAFQDSVQDNLMREQELREAQSEIERLRADLYESEQAAAQEKLASDDAKLLMEAIKRDLEVEREAREREAEEMDEERGKSRNLQSVLADFEAGTYPVTLQIQHISVISAKNREVQNCKQQLEECVQSLAEFKSRALTAEVSRPCFLLAMHVLTLSLQVQLDEMRASVSRVQELEEKLREKSLLIEKLRLEGAYILSFFILI